MPSLRKCVLSLSLLGALTGEVSASHSGRDAELGWPDLSAREPRRFARDYAVLPMIGLDDVARQGEGGVYPDALDARVAAARGVLGYSSGSLYACAAAVRAAVAEGAASHVTAVAAVRGVLGGAGTLLERSKAARDAVDTGATSHEAAVARVASAVGVGGVGSLYEQTAGLLESLKINLMEKRSKSIVAFIGMSLERERDGRASPAMVGLLEALRAIHPDVACEAFFTARGGYQTSEAALTIQGAIQATVLNLLSAHSDLPEALQERFRSISSEGKAPDDPECLLAQLRDRTRLALGATTLVGFLEIERML